MKRIFIKFTFLIFVLNIFYSNYLLANITGNVQLENENNHSDIKVKFIPHSKTSQLVSTFSNDTGDFTLNLKPGLYKIEFSKNGFQSYFYDYGQIIAVSENEVLKNITLIKGSTVFVEGEVFGTWDSSNIYIVNHNIVIPKGKKLFIKPGTTIKFNGFYTIFVEGSLIAIGEPNNKILFTSNKEKPNLADWNRIHFKNNLSVVLNSIIEYADYPLYSENIKHIKTDVGPYIINNEIRYFNKCGVYALSSNNIIVNNYIHDYKGVQYSIGIWTQSQSNKSIVECNTIVNGNGYGIYTTSSNIIKNNIVKNIQYSSDIRYGRGTGIDISNSCKPLISNNYLDSNFIGFVFSSSVSSIPNPLILNNTITNSTSFGVVSEGNYGYGKVINNIIYNNNVGIRNNTIHNDGIEEISNNIIFGNKTDLEVEKIVGIGKILNKYENNYEVDAYQNIYSNPNFIAPFPKVDMNSPVWNNGNELYSKNIGYNPDCDCKNSIFNHNYDFIINYSDENIIKDTIIRNDSTDISYTFKVRSFPNPFDEILNIDFTLEKSKFISIELFSILGNMKHLIKSEDLEEGYNTVTFDTKNLDKGLYLLIIKDNNNLLYSKLHFKL